MLQAFPMSLTGAASRWLRNEPSGLITNWETMKTKFLNKYCPPARTAKKMEEINNFQQEPDESLFRAWERFKELLMKYPQYYLTDMQEVILFYNGLNVPTRQILDSKGAIPTKTAADAKPNSTTSGEKLRINEKVYACELCKGPHYTKDCPLKEEGKTLEEAYYTQFGAPYQPRGQYRAVGPEFYQHNNGNSSYPDRRQTLEESLTKFMAESAKRHEENSNIIKKIRASTDSAIRNQGASIKTLEIQIGQSLTRKRNQKCFQKKITLRIEEEKLIFKSIKPATSIIRRVYVLKEGTDLDSKTEFIGATINESFDPHYGNYIELNDLDMPLEPRMDQDNKFEPTLDFVNKHTYKNSYKMKSSCIIRYKHVIVDFLPTLSINMITKRFYNSIIKDKGDHEGKNLAGTLIDIPIFVGNFSIISGFSIIDDVNITSGVVLGMPFCKKFVSCQKIMERIAHGDEYERMDD
ncbi:pyruvate dehydrogenase (acetyl-transferring) kinase, mitochondrial [Tanacetum coccineum]